MSQPLFTILRLVTIVQVDECNFYRNKTIILRDFHTGENTNVSTENKLQHSGVKFPVHISYYPSLLDTPGRFIIKSAKSVGHTACLDQGTKPLSHSYMMEY